MKTYRILTFFFQVVFFVQHFWTDVPTTKSGCHTFWAARFGPNFSPAEAQEHGIAPPPICYGINSHHMRLALWYVDR